MTLGTISVETCIPNSPSVCIYNVSATIDIDGQCCVMNVKAINETPNGKCLLLHLQKRHYDARISMNVSSDHDEPCKITVVTITPGFAATSHYYIIGMDGTLSWQLCSVLGKRINRDTVWEIWAPSGIEEEKCKVLSISFSKCNNNKEECLGESLGVSDGNYDSKNESEEECAEGGITQKNISDGCARPNKKIKK